MNILQGKDLTILVKKRTLIRHFSFGISNNEMALLKGASGSGKSTLLHAILGFYPLANGQVFFRNKQINARTIHQLRKQTVFIPQNVQFNFDTVEAFLKFPFTFRHNKNLMPSKQTINQWLAYMELPEDILENSTGNISGGELQRIVLISAMLQRKTLYLMDEPTSAMDRHLREKTLHMLSQGPGSILVTSHDAIWENYANRVLFLPDQE